jgi:hypothetical protein
MNYLARMADGRAAAAMVKIFMRQFPLVGAYLAMKPILAVFWNICLLRRGPELVPTHPLFVGSVIVLNVLVGFFVGVQASEANAVQVATSTLVSMAAIAVITWIALSARGVVGRFPATITAMFGCDLLFTSLIAVIVPIVGITSPVTVWTWALITIWTIAVYGFILHRAMNVTVFVGIVFSFCMAFISIVLAGAASNR